MTPWPDETRPEKRVVADVGPDVEEDVSGPERGHEARRLFLLDAVEVDKGAAALAGQRPEDELRPAERAAKDGIGHTGEQSPRHEVRDRPEQLGQIGKYCSLLSIVRNLSSSSLRTRPA